MTMNITNGDCLTLMKELPDKSVDLFICDLPYGETNCKWDCVIDLEEFWKEFKRLRKSKRTACIHFCSTKFGYTLIKSNEKMFKMDMVWKKRNKTGGLQSRHRPMRNHEMVYFFYEQAPQYNRDKYHKRIQAKKEPPNPASVISEAEREEKDEFGWDKSVVKEHNKVRKFASGANFTPPNPASVLEADREEELIEPAEEKYNSSGYKKELVDGIKNFGTNGFTPPNPPSVLEADEPKSMFESKKVFIGKRHHQTEKPLDILEFFIKYWSDEGQTILDPTMGSGSTGVACKTLKRNFIGFEMDENIFKVAEGRIEKIII